MLPLILLDIILAGVMLEAAVLALRLKGRRRRLVQPLLLFLASGAALLFAVRAALAGMEEALVAASLFVAGILHVLCLLQTSRRFSEVSDD
jgi:hypothetical protein